MYIYVVIIWRDAGRLGVPACLYIDIPPQYIWGREGLVI
jgi:hypothetical protein